MSVKARFKNAKEYNEYKVFETQNMIWDWEFKRFKNRIERERYRNEYDAIKSKLEILNKQMAEFPKLGWSNLEVNKQEDMILLQQDKKSKWSDEQNRMDDEKTRMEKDLKVYETNMRNMDEELNGAKPSAENPTPNPSIEEMISAFRDLLNVYKAYLKIL